MPDPAQDQCTVEYVIDGDTIECESGERIRLLLIDTPELSQASGPAARTALAGLLPRGTVAAVEQDVQERDGYGRLLAYLYTPDGRMVNETMVQLGYAIVAVYPPNVRHVDRLRAAQASARRQQRGLWAASAFECRPAEHRRDEC